MTVESGTSKIVRFRIAFIIHLPYTHRSSFVPSKHHFILCNKLFQFWLQNLKRLGSENCSKLSTIPRRSLLASRASYMINTIRHPLHTRNGYESRSILVEPRFLTFNLEKATTSVFLIMQLLCKCNTVFLFLRVSDNPGKSLTVCLV